MPSVFSSAVPKLVEDIYRTFTNQFSLIQPYRDDDILPGERYGIINFESYARNPATPALQSNRLGAESKELRATIIIRTAFDGTGLTEFEALRQADVLFLQWSLDLEDGLCAMKHDINNQEFVYDLELGTEPIDKLCVVLKDKTTHRLVITAQAVLKLMIRRDADGRHESPLWRRDLNHG